MTAYGVQRKMYHDMKTFFICKHFQTSSDSFTSVCTSTCQKLEPVFVKPQNATNTDSN